MIWTPGLSDEPLSQGDLLEECPILVWEGDESAILRSRVIVLTQACDLAQNKFSRVVVAIVHEARTLVDQGTLKAVTIRDQVRSHRIWGWYFLPAGSGLPESLVDLRDLHTVPRELLEELIADGQRVARLLTPYREHMAQHFATTYARIALPEPYETES